MLLKCYIGKAIDSFRPVSDWPGPANRTTRLSPFLFVIVVYIHYKHSDYLGKECNHRNYLSNYFVHSLKTFYLVFSCTNSDKKYNLPCTKGRHKTHSDLG